MRRWEVNGALTLSRCSSVLQLSVAATSHAWNGRCQGLIDSIPYCGQDSLIGVADIGKKSRRGAVNPPVLCSIVDTEILSSIPDQGQLSLHRPSLT